jgi:hypothetical protein
VVFVPMMMMMMKMKMMMKGTWMQEEALQLKIARHLLRSVVRQVNAQAQRKYHEPRKTVRSH